jgi:hypothetical protein
MCHSGIQEIAAIICEIRWGVYQQTPEMDFGAEKVELILFSFFFFSFFFCWVMGVLRVW